MKKSPAQKVIIQRITHFPNLSWQQLAGIEAAMDLPVDMTVDSTPASVWVATQRALTNVNQDIVAVAHSKKELLDKLTNFEVSETHENWN